MKTNIESLIPDSHRITALKAAESIISNPALLNDFINIILQNKYPDSMRAANVILHVGTAKPALVNDYINQLIYLLPQLRVEGARRGIIKLLRNRKLKFDEEVLGFFINTCFDFLLSSGESIAVRAYAMDVLMDLYKKEPSIKNELISALENQLETPSKGIKSKIVKLLKVLNKQGL